MRRNTRILTVSLLAFLLGWSSASHHEKVSAQQVAEQESAVVFCVTASDGLTGAAMEPLVIVEGGKYKAPVDGTSSEDTRSQFADTFYRAGQTYRLLFGGGEAGSVSVKSSAHHSDCFRTGAAVNLKSQVKLNRNVMALATNSDRLGSRPGYRRAPTTRERSEVLRLVKQIFTSKGVPRSLLSTLNTVNLTAADVDRDGNAELIGTFLVTKTKGPATRFVLFLLAEPHGDAYTKGIVNYESYTDKDIMSGGSLDSIGADGIYTEKFVDQLEMDCHGVREVITITQSFEGVTYHIYKKDQGQWRSVYEFANYRCAF